MAILMKIIINMMPQTEVKLLSQWNIQAYSCPFHISVSFMWDK